MRYYENLFIVHPNYEQERLNKVIESVKDRIQELGGSIFSVDDWGKKRLAYLVSGQRFGNYVLIRFGGEGNIVRELKEWMQVNQAILMDITVRLEKKPEAEKVE